MTAALLRLDTRRAEAAERFRTLGLPHRRVEAWKYTDLRAATDVAKVERAQAVRWTVEQRSGDVELVDLAEGALPDWVTAHLGALRSDSALGAASLAFAQAGFALRVPRGKAGAVHVTLASEGQGRVLIVLEEDAELLYSETVAGSLAGVQNIGVEVRIGANAHFTHARIAHEAAKAIQIADIAATVARNGSYRLHSGSFGAELSRQELKLSLDGEGAEAHLAGVSVLGDGTHSDVTTHIVHAAGNTQSTQLFKNVAGGRSRAVYQGQITVAKGANGSDSRQTAKALLLGPRAEADLKPELEIFADDVKCAHGAAVGDLDMDSLFYLRARGIPEAEARNLLIRAFLEEAVSAIGNDALRDTLWQAVEQALPQVLEAAP
jgi:Fe-S cluster assembly protein SufD